MVSRSSRLDALLHGEQGKYGYLFPLRDRIPTINGHIFTDLKQSKNPLNEVVLSKMLDIDYIGWTTKVILGVELLPIQIATLQVLWNTPFPMLIACRGGGKSFMLAIYAILKALLDPGTKIVIVGAGLRQARLVFNYIDAIWSSSPILRNIVGGGKNAGPRQNVDLCYFKIGDSIIYALPTGDGCASKDTLVLYKDGFGTIADDQPSTQMTKNIVLRDRRIWGNGRFRLSDESYCNGKSKTKKIVTSKGFEFEGTYNHKVKVLRDTKVQWVRLDEMEIGDRVLIDRSVRWHSGTSDVTVDEGYALGLLIGDGCFTYPDRISFSTADVELLKAMECIGNFVKRRTNPYEYLCYGTKKRLDFLSRFGVNPVLSYEKTIPTTVMSSSRNTMSAFLRGLFDSDGGVQIVRPNAKSIGGMIRLTSTSKKLLQQVQFILLHYGIISSIKKKKGNERSRHQCYDLSICGKNVKLFDDDIGFGLKRKQDILDQIIKEKKAYKDRDDVIPGINELMSEISKEHEHNLVGKERLAFNTMMFRIRKGKQSKSQAKRFLEIFGHAVDTRLDLISSLVNDGLYYDDITSIEDNECITFDVHVPETHEYCANGLCSHNTKIRGFRANVVIADEFAAIQEDVFDVVIRGFASTTKTPVEEAKRIAFDRQLSKIDLPSHIKKSLVIDDGKMRGNQIIYSGTAYYAFNHFAKRHQMWHDIISSNGKLDRVSQIFGGENLIPDCFNYKDYAIIRIPHTHLPDGLLDQRQLANAKATLPRNIYLMEYGACASKELMVNTDVGTKQIIDVEIGDNVFSHTGQYKRVTAKKYRHYRGDMINLKIGNDTNIHVTPNHLLWNGETFIRADKLNIGSMLCIPRPKLSDHHAFDLTEYCHDYREQIYDCKKYIYPRPSMSVRCDVFAKNNTSTKYHKCGQNFKSSIPRQVEASHDLGLILGFYAADGSIGANDKQIEISFNITQRDRATKFADAVSNVFGLESHFTDRHKDNTLRVTVNSRVLCQFIKGTVGCGASTKRISNIKQFTKSMACGFIAGYWMGDGSITEHNISATSVSHQLLEDVRFLLLATGCYGGITQKTLHECHILGKLYNTKPIWRLYVPANYRKRFMNIIDNNPSTTRILVPVRDKTIFDYDDYVYNLEVSEDHSYLACGAIHHNCFVKDSDGFYPRSLIEGCTVGPNKPIDTPDGAITFTPIMRGIKGPKYVIGIDPAAERDNLAIVVIEVWDNHYRVVYCWAVNKKEFVKRKKRGLVIDDDYYAYCCSRIREIVRLFNPVRIEMDSQGGGYAVAEMLRSKKLLDMDKGDFPIYEVIYSGDPKSTDGETDGRHILHLVKQSSEFNQGANIALHKSLETHTLLFPAFDSVKMYSAIEAEKSMGVIFDTYEENVFNLEELKNELCTIQMSETATGKERFDTPHVAKTGAVEGRNRKGRLRKDRYTALLLSHKYIYDADIAPDDDIDYEDVVGNINKREKPGKNEVMYRGSGVGRMKNAEGARQGDIFKAIKRGKNI